MCYQHTELTGETVCCMALLGRVHKGRMLRGAVPPPAFILKLLPWPYSSRARYCSLSRQELKRNGSDRITPSRITRDDKSVRGRAKPLIRNPWST